MANMLDYLAWRGDLSFSESPFNKIDALIAAELAYVEFDGVLTDDPKQQLTLREACSRYQALGNRQPPVVNDPRPMMMAAAKTRRFGPLMLGGYTDLLDPEREMQLAALTVYLGDGSAVAAFRGTDNSIVGWREDFSFSYQEHTAGQREAAAYLSRLGAAFPGPIRVTGHSKGGNFAVYAAAFCDASLRHSRVLRVYANDAPGFQQSLAESPELRSILDKTEVFIPESSLIGILLSTKEEKQIVKSSASGLYQHNPYSWQILGTDFVEADSRSASSLFMDETLRRWLANLNGAERADFVKAVFDSLESSGALTMHEMKLEPMATANAIITAVSRMSPELQKSAFATLGKLAAAGGVTLREGLMQLLHPKKAETKEADAE